MIRSTCSILLAVALWPSGVLAAPGPSDLMSRASALSPEVKAFEAALAVSDAQARQALSAFLPQVSLSGNALKLEGSPVAVFGMPSSQSGMAGIGGGAGMSFVKPGDPMVLGSATVTQPLFAGFRNLGGFQVARLGQEAARLDLEHARREAGLDGLVALLQYEAQRATAQAADAQQRQAAVRLALATARSRAGSLSEVDRLQASVQLRRLDTQRATVRRSLDLARQELALRLGDDFPLESKAPEPALAFKSPDEAYARALAERLDLRALGLREEAAGNQTQVAQAGYWPMVSAFGTVSQLGSDSANQGTLYGAQVVWTAFDGLKTPAGVALAEAQRARQRADREALRRAIQRQVREAWNRHADAEGRLALRQAELVVAQEAQRVAERLKVAGSADLGEATDAETSLIQAQAEVRSAELARAIAVAELAKAVGLSYESLVGKEN